MITRQVKHLGAKRPFLVIIIQIKLAGAQFSYLDYKANFIIPCFLLQMSQNTWAKLKHKLVDGIPINSLVLNFIDVTFSNRFKIQEAFVSEPFTELILLPFPVVPRANCKNSLLICHKLVIMPHTHKHESRA